MDTTTRVLHPLAPQVNPHDLQVVDLFCGAGGLAEGFRLAGFETILGVDFWQPACQTFAANHPTARVAISDITTVSNDELLAWAEVRQGTLGVLCGGPPCQGFSVAGKRMSDDPRNFLYKHFLRAVEVFQPKWVVMENVPNLLNHSAVVPAIYRDFAELGTPTGYALTHGLVLAARYGVPQTRTRVLFVARRMDSASEPAPSIIHMMPPTFSQEVELFSRRAYVTFDEATADLPCIPAGDGAEEMPYDKPATTPYQSLMRGSSQLPDFFSAKHLDPPRFWAPIQPSGKVYNHRAQKHSPLLIQRFANIPPGGSKEDLRTIRPDLLPPEGHPEQGLTYGRLWPDRPATAIPANYSRPSGNRSIHPHQPRLITPREAMRLSSFPDAYRLSGLMVAQREQVGNAVPPLMAFRLAESIRELS